MSVGDMAAEAAAWARRLEGLRTEARQRDAAGSGIRTVLDDDSRQTLDRLDEVALERRDAEANARQANRSAHNMGWAAAGSAVPLATAGAAALLSWPVAAFAAPLVVGGMMLGICGALALGERRYARFLHDKIPALEAEKARLEERLDDSVAPLREADEQHLVESLRTAGGRNADDPLTGRMGMLVMDALARDPAVARTTYQLDKTESAISRKTKQLEMPRAELFTAEAARVMEKRAVALDGWASVALLGSIALAFGVGFGVNPIFHGVTSAYIGIAAWLPAAFAGTRKLAPALADSAAERQTRAELRSEVATLEPQVEPLRQTLREAKDAALTRLTEFLRTTPIPAAPSRTVEKSDGQVIIGGVAVERRS